MAGVNETKLLNCQIAFLFLLRLRSCTRCIRRRLLLQEEENHVTVCQSMSECVFTTTTITTAAAAYAFPFPWIPDPRSHRSRRPLILITDMDRPCPPLTCRPAEHPSASHPASPTSHSCPSSAKSAAPIPTHWNNWIAKMLISASLNQSFRFSKKFAGHTSRVLIYVIDPVM